MPNHADLLASSSVLRLLMPIVPLFSGSSVVIRAGFDRNQGRNVQAPENARNAQPEY